ncbi:MAG: ATP-binding protein [Bacteroidales bacterium]|nr:ATP-binding protein [Bacteroidales bacterium]
MAKAINPFIVTGKIEPDYFCDRVSESARLIKSLVNGNNMVVISPRRMGKTGLIRFCYEKPEIKDSYDTFFIDILHTSSLKEFTYILGKEIFESLAPRSKTMSDLFLQTLKSISGKFGFDPFTNLPTFNVELGDIQRPEYTLEEIFTYLAAADKPCIVAIDEFQQIAKYPEKNMEALLRTHIQKIRNSHFIFAGSERHIMQEMFTSSARPFYQSADILELNAIDEPIYVKFIMELFESRDRTISKEVVGRVYHLFKGHTYFIQKTFNEAFSDTLPGEECTLETLNQTIDNLIAGNATIFREILSNIPEKQKELLYAIARDGEAERITSSEFLKKHSLSSASSIQSAIKKLLEKDLVTELNKKYAVTDKLFAMWINTIYGKKFNL